MTGAVHGNTPFVFLFTDVEGSTRLWEQHAEQMRPAMQRHDEILRKAVRAHSGEVVKMSGDGIHAVFSDAAQALAAAIAIQQMLREPLAGLSLRVRSAIHAGPAEARDGDYYGPAVNRAARLAAAAHGGQILVSDQAQALLQTGGDLPCTLRLLGNVRLRDLSAAEPVWQVVHAGLTENFPALRAMAEHPNNLPNARNVFFGRRAQLADIDRQFARARLVTLCGAGGMGKSRLAQHAGARLIDRFSDGVWWVELAPLADAAEVLPAVAGVLKLQEVRGQTLKETLVRRLAGQQVLLMLDNCEHVIEEVARLVDDLLRDCPGLQVLATSREPLEIEGEALIQVPPLATPEADFPSGLAALLEVDATQLLLDRARLQSPDFHLAEADAPLLARVVNRLDGIPLAIELAAARLRTLTLAELDGGLNDRFGLLVAGTRFAPARHKTLRGLIDWSFDLLSEEEQWFFMHAAVFSGSFSAQAAARVVPDAPPLERVADVLRGLADKSLIELHGAQGEYSRYRMLETLRQYAWEKLASGGWLESARLRHLRWMGALMRDIPPIPTSSRQELLSMIAADLDNARSALAYAVERADRWDDALECARVLGEFWYRKRQFAEGRRILEPIAGRLLALQADEEWRTVARGDSAARLHYYVGRFHYMQAMAAETEAACDQAESIARERGDFGLVGLVMALKAHNRFVQHGHLASRDLYNEALRLLIEHDMSPPSVVHDLCNVANNALHAGVLDDVTHYRDWAERFAQGRLNLAEHPNWRMQTGLTLMARGQAQEACNEFQAAIDISRRNGDLLAEVQPSVQLGIARWATGDVAGAIASIKAACEMMRAAHPAIEGINSLEALAMVLAESGRTEAGALLQGACDRLRQDTGFPAGAQARNIRERARVALSKADPQSVERWLREGATLTTAQIFQMVGAL